MEDVLKESELFAGLEAAALSRFASIARPRLLRTGEYLFLLGDGAESLYVVRKGKIELCFPFSFGGQMRDIPIETKLPGSAVGWSAFVEPFRFTLSARAAEPSEALAFSRRDLQQAFEADARSGCAVMQRVAAMIGHRLLAVQALWARELQRAMTATTRTVRPSSGSAPTGA